MNVKEEVRMGSLRIYLAYTAETSPNLKVTRSRDGVQLYRHAWKKLGLNKGRGKFVNLSSS